MSQPLRSTVVGFHGKFAGYKHVQLMGIVRDSGGECSTLPKRCTHLVVAEKARHTRECTQAFSEGVAIVSLAWLLYSNHPSKANKCLLEDGYKFKPHIERNNGNQSKSSITNRSRKKPENGGNAFKEQNTSVQDFPDGGYSVYKSSGTTWDVTLEKTTLGNDKQVKRTLFYHIRLFASRSGGGYRTWTNWGIVGKQGQEKLMYNDSDLDRAQQLFREKFEEKTGLPWKDRTNAPLNGYYRYIPQGKSESAESV